MKYRTIVLWERRSIESFTDNKYSRVHKWTFDGGVELPASASPHIVPVPMSDESAVDPEEAFVASLSSCHMLFFLSIAAKQNYIIDRYEDHAEGTMGKNEQGKPAMIEVNLHPKVTFSGSNIPDEDQIDKIHELAHAQCFIANSVRTKINIITN
jgi:organic hydroperoxide reductase OsmC/OhrA